MPFTIVRHERYRRVEPWLALLFLLLKVLLLRGTWGKIQGFDAPHWIDVLRVTHWFEPLPPPRALLASYHPPLSYLLGRLVVVFIPQEVEASQVLSTLSLVGAFFALRHALRHIGWLATLPGLILLYGGFSIPLLVWLSIETGYDGLVFFWFSLAFAQSIALFWQPVPKKWWRDAKFSFGVVLLGLTLAAGMLTKFSNLIALGLPFLVVFVRRGLHFWRRETVPSVLALVVSLIVVMPLYAHRYFAADSRHLQAAMDWQRPLDLAMARALCEKAPLRCWGNVLQLPNRSIIDSPYPVVESFLSSIWLQTWKKDGCLGVQPSPSLKVSNFYLQFFPLLLLGGTAWFIVRRRQIPKPWRHLGWVLIWIAILFCASALAFAWNYPLWDWRVFKAKYMTPAILWTAYAAGSLYSDQLFETRQKRWKQWAEQAALVGLIAFMVVNHALPVY
jgi:hypothetical protein